MPNIAFRRVVALALSTWFAGTGVALPLTGCLPAAADPLPGGQSIPAEGTTPVPGQPSAFTPSPLVNGAPGQAGPPIGTFSSAPGAPLPPQPAPPPNPLVLPSPLTGNGNPTVYYNRDGQQRPDLSADDEADYTHSTVSKRDLRPLSLFGYDFFQSARRVIEARQAFLIHQYGMTPGEAAAYRLRPYARPLPEQSLDVGQNPQAGRPGQPGRYQDGNDASSKELQDRAQELAPAASATVRNRAAQQRQYGPIPYSVNPYNGAPENMQGYGPSVTGPMGYGVGYGAPGYGTYPDTYPENLGDFGLSAAPQSPYAYNSYEDSGYGPTVYAPGAPSMSGENAGGRFSDTANSGTLYGGQNGVQSGDSASEDEATVLPPEQQEPGPMQGQYGDPQTTPGGPDISGSGYGDGGSYGDGSADNPYVSGSPYAANPDDQYGAGQDSYGYGNGMENGQGYGNQYGYGNPYNEENGYGYANGGQYESAYPETGSPAPYPSPPNAALPYSQNAYPQYAYPGAASGLTGEGTGAAALGGGAAGAVNGAGQTVPGAGTSLSPETAYGELPSYPRPGFGTGYPQGGYGTYGAQMPPSGVPPMLSEENPTPVNAYSNIADPLTELYRNVTASVPASYQLSPGDSLTVRYSSPTMYPRQYDLTVDPQGGITVPGAGRFVVVGLTVGQADRLLTSRLRGLYNSPEVSVTLKELRTISVTVTGQAFAPGTYEVPAVASAFNVLYAAGGPTYDGSLRDIEVRRQGRLVGTLDVYQLLLGSGRFHDIRLQSGDLISVMPVVSRVTVRGEVRLPAVYELTEHETLHDALRFARGVKPSGVTQDVEIDTIRPGQARELKDINLTNLAQVTTTPLYDGDVVDVFSIQSLITNKVTIAGAVNDPGDYALLSGMRVSDLLQRARGALPDAYTTRADLYRWNPNNTTTLIPIDMTRALAHDPTADVPLVRWDKLQIYTLRQVQWTGERQVTVRGAVQHPGVYTRSNGMHARDLLLQAGGPTPEGDMNQVILLHQHADGTFKYETVDLSPDSTADPLLQDDDVLAVYTTQQAQFDANHIVTVLGEVVAPGPYPRGSGMRLSDLLKLAGGFRPDAATHVSIAHAYKVVDDPAAQPVAIQVTFDAQGNTMTGDNVLLQDGDVVTVQGTGGYQDHVSVVMVKGAVNRPGPVIITDKMRLSDAIRAAGGLRDVAYPQGAGFNRETEYLSNNEQRSLSQIISRLNDMLNASDYKRELAKSDVERIQAVQTATQDNTSFLPIGNTTNSAAPNPAAATLSQQLSQHDLVTPARTLTDGDLVPSGDLAVNLASALRRPGGPDDLLLKDGDVITVPEQPTTVQVVGAVFNPRGVMFKTSESISYYINQCGGFAPDAATDRIEVIHAGGGLTLASKAHGLQPGDLILVPTKVLAEKISRSGNGFTDFLSGLFGTAILVKVLSSL